MADQERYPLETHDEYPEDAGPDHDDMAWPPEEDGGLLQSGMVRFTLVVMGVVALLIVGVVAWLYLYRQSRDKPLDVAIYPGAQMITEETVYDGLDHHQYVTDAPFADVEAFYGTQNAIICEPQYTTVQERDGTTYREGHLSTTCRIDRSGFGVSQYAIITIQPILDDAGNPTDQVMIDITRHWGE